MKAFKIDTLKVFLSLLILSSGCNTLKQEGGILEDESANDGYSYFGKQIESKQFSLPMATSYEGGILLLVDNIDTEEDRRDVNLVEINPKTGEQYFFGPFEGSHLEGVFDDHLTLYFLKQISSNGPYNLFTYDLDSKQSTLVSLPDLGTTWEESITQFILVGNELIYFRGGCNEIYDCDLLIYNFETKENRPLLEDLPSGKVSGYRLLAYDPLQKEVTILEGGGDGPYAFFKIYEVDVNNPTLQLIESYSINGNCTEETLNQEDSCTEEILNKNQLYEVAQKQLFPPPFCTDVEVEETNYLSTVIIHTSTDSFEIPHAEFVYCD